MIQRLCLLIISLLFNSAIYCQTNNILSQDTKLKDNIFNLDSAGNCKIELVQDSIRNCILMITTDNLNNPQSGIVSIAGIGNAEFENGKGKIYKCFFEKGKYTYLIKTFIEGSTYGALAYFLVYDQDGDNYWQIIKIPFDVIEVVTNSKGLSEIIRYAHNGEKIKYTFRHGLFLQVN